MSDSTEPYQLWVLGNDPQEPPDPEPEPAWKGTTIRMRDYSGSIWTDMVDDSRPVAAGSVINVRCDHCRAVIPCVVDERSSIDWSHDCAVLQ